MKTFATNEKRSAPAVRKACPYVHHPMGPVQQAQQAEVRHILRSTGAQARLNIGQPDDKYEQEADRVADQVMRMPDPKLQRQLENEEEEEMLQPKPLADQITPLVQRQEEHEEEEEESVQAKAMPGQETAQRQPMEEEEEEEEVQPGYDQEPEDLTPILESVPTGDADELAEEEEEFIQPKSNTGTMPQVTPKIAHAIHSIKGSGQPLPASERAFFEPRFGTDFSNVRVHTDNHAVRTAQSINARAFTLGHDVVFGAGQYSPTSLSGRSLLAHELTHVIQQGGGRIRTKTQHRESIDSDPIDAQRVTHATAITQRTSALRVQRAPAVSTPLIRNQRSKRILSNMATLSRLDPKVNAIVTSGQFYWGIKLATKLASMYSAALNSWPAAHRNTLKNHFDNLLTQCRHAQPNKWKTRAKIKRHMWQLVRTGVASNSARKKLLKILGKFKYIKLRGKRISNRSKAWGKEIFNSLWWTFFKKGTNTVPGNFIDFDFMEALRKYEMGACSITLQHTKRILRRTSTAGTGNRSKSTKLRITPLCRGVARSNYNDLYDEVKYRGLASVVAKMKQALDDGWFIHVRVMSGVRASKGGPGGRNTPLSCTPEDHSLLIIDYYNNRFLFTDPDAAVTKSFSQGMGSLFYLSGSTERLTTAKSNSISDRQINIAGYHSSGGEKRYQAIKLWSV